MRETNEVKTLIVGLGKTGLSCARYLAARGLPVAITDSRSQPPGLAELESELPDTALFLGQFDSLVFEAAEQLVVSPGVAVSEPLIQAAIARGVPVIGDIELFAREVKTPVVAITGSNGKSTVTTLLGKMAETAGRRVALGGNLGEPALDLLDPAVELYILELSSFQLETTHTLAPAVSVVLNLSADHMDRYSDFDAYADVKAGIYRHAVARVFNLDDPRVMTMRGTEGEDLLFTLGVPAAEQFGVDYREGRAWLCLGEQELLPISELKIPGRHNVANALAALAMGSLLKLPMPAMLEALQHFPGLPHRTQFVAEHRNVRWYNDSKGTNVGACIAALEGMKSDQGSDRTVLIAGGDGKGADFSPLAAVVAATARAVILIGRDAPLIAQALKGTVTILYAGNMEEAVGLAAEQAEAGDRVLLSPACASFDMFRDYQRRGEQFMDAVRRLVQ
ncbi:MAG: UDP-N-acetylmuramoyl-L-alanine--D-glutamate ligase [Candidatus Sedimenticola sp. (ex Thyasira tokunagai)]